MLEGLAAPLLFPLSLSLSLSFATRVLQSVSFSFQAGSGNSFSAVLFSFFPPFQPLFQRGMTCQALHLPTDIGALPGGGCHTD